jgi:hypothetical protein
MDFPALADENLPWHNEHISLCVMAYVLLTLTRLLCLQPAFLL